MAGKFCINLTCSTDNADRATVAFVVANAAVASDKDTLVFLSIEAVRLSQQGVAESIHEEGFAPLKDFALDEQSPRSGWKNIRVLALL